MTVGLWLAGFNSIVAASIAALVMVLFFSRGDAELVRRASIGGLAAVILMFTTYWVGFFVSTNTEAVLASIWLLYDEPLGERLVGVPVTELLWAMSFGSLVALF
jgi:hypothetical protein